VKERRKPDRPWQSGETGGGLPNQTNLPRKRGSGSTRRWKAPGVAAAGLLDGRAAKAVLAAIEGSASRRARGGGDVGVRGHLPAPSGPIRLGWRGTAMSVPDAATSERRRRGFHRERMGRSWSGAPSSAPSAGVGSSQDGLAPHGRSRPRSAKNSAVGAARAARPEIERSTGARVEGRFAEVGEKHLVHSVEGSREANRDEVG